MNLADGDSPQLYIPADVPYSWVTMDMLFWALGILAALALTALALAAWAVREAVRLRRLVRELRAWAEDADPYIPSRAATSGRHARTETLEAVTHAHTR